VIEDIDEFQLKNMEQRSPLKWLWIKKQAFIGILPRQLWRG
jgi:hypothetical protein